MAIIIACIVSILTITTYTNFILPVSLLFEAIPFLTQFTTFLARDFTNTNNQNPNNDKVENVKYGK